MQKTENRFRLAARATSIGASPTLVVSNRAKELLAKGIDVIDFGAGEPDFGTPPSIAAAAKKAIDDGFTHYTNTAGCSELRCAIADRYNERYDAGLTQDHVIAGTGGKQELFNLALTLVDDGDEVIIPSPYWVSFPDQVTFAGGKPVFSVTRRSENFRPTTESIRAAVTPRTRGVILNSPCNPTGAVIEAGELEGIIRLCADRGLFLIFDETYEFFVYDGLEHVSAMRWFRECPETVVVVNSMSKTFAMTGWRLGFAIGHPEIIAALGTIQSHSTSNPSSISQLAAVEAIRGGGAEVSRMFEAYVARREWLCPALNEIPGFDCQSPDGAFYIFPRVDSLYGRGGIANSTDFSNYLLEKARVAVVPGAAFGADEYIRISYATSLEKLQEGVRRLRTAVEQLRTHSS